MKRYLITILLLLILSACVTVETKEKVAVDQPGEVEGGMTDATPNDTTPKDTVIDVLEDDTLETPNGPMCDFPDEEVYCSQDPVITSESVELTMRNDRGLPVIIQKIEGFDNCDNVIVKKSLTSEFEEIDNQVVQSDRVFAIRAEGCSNGAVGSEVTLSISVDYMDELTEIEHTTSGMIIGIVG